MSIIYDGFSVYLKTVVAMQVSTLSETEPVNFSKMSHTSVRARG